jgi:hypothetical protein
MMSPRFSYRGNDGAFVGSGFHLPLSKRYEPSPEYLDVSFGSYLFSGVDLGAQLVTANTVTNLRWDYLKHGLVEFDATGNHAFGDTVAVAWRADSIRGTRARSGYVSFEAASRAYDHNRVELLHAEGQSLLCLGFQNTAMRGIPLREMDLWGPSARASIGTNIGNFGHVDSSTVAYGLVTNTSGIEALTLHNSTLGFDARPGPFAIKTAAHENWLIASGGLNGMSEGLLGAETQVSLPFVRSFGSEQNRFSHWIEPQLLSTVAWQRSVDVTRNHRYEETSSAQVGLLNVFGRSRAATATSLLMRAGWVEQGDTTQQAFAARWLSSGPWLALGGSVGTVKPWEPSERVWLSTLRGRVGRLDKVALGASVAGRSVTEPTAVRWLLDEGFRPWLAQWYSTPGWTLGSQLDVGLLDQVATTAGVTMDLEREKLLAHRLGIAYRHPCGCLAASSIADWRVGRHGWDVTVLLDLMP